MQQCVGKKIYIKVLDDGWFLMVFWGACLLPSRRIQGTLGAYLREGFKAHWEPTLAKDSRHVGSLP